MSNKKNAQAPAPDKEETALYYDLKKEAVETLATATAENSPEVPEAELKKYRRDFIGSIPAWIKILFGKWWFAGAACFFIFWGLGTVIPDMLDMIVVLGVALGMLTDVILNNIIRYFSENEATYRKWLMFPRKAFWTFFANILYAFFLLFFVIGTYNLLNLGLISLSGKSEGALPLGVGPILFGLFYMGFDVLFVSMRNLFRRIVQDAEKSLKEGSGK